jgi:hypothetical protein
VTGGVVTASTRFVASVIRASASTGGVLQNSSGGVVATFGGDSNSTDLKLAGVLKYSSNLQGANTTGTYSVYATQTLDSANGQSIFEITSSLSGDYSTITNTVRRGLGIAQTAWVKDGSYSVTRGINNANQIFDLVGTAAGNLTILLPTGATATETYATREWSAGQYAATSHTHSATAITSGTLGVARGGTGATTHTSGNVLIGAGTSAITSLSRSGIDTRTVFPSNWDAVSGNYLPYTGATANVDLGVRTLTSARLLTPELRATSSAGILIEASNGVDIGTLGAGDTTAVSWVGAHAFAGLVSANAGLATTSLTATGTISAFAATICERTGVTANAFLSRETSDIAGRYRHIVRIDGTHEWGIGGATRDTFAWRSGVGELSIGTAANNALGSLSLGALTASGLITANAGIAGTTATMTGLVKSGTTTLGNTPPVANNDLTRKDYVDAIAASPSIPREFVKLAAYTPPSLSTSHYRVARFTLPNTEPHFIRMTFAVSAQVSGNDEALFDWYWDRDGSGDGSAATAGRNANNFAGFIRYQETSTNVIDVFVEAVESFAPFTWNYKLVDLDAGTALLTGGSWVNTAAPGSSSSTGLNF